MASGTMKAIRGSFLGTGADIDIRSVGFRPRCVKLWNIDGIATAVWLDGMADASAFKAITAGTKSVITTLGITPLSDGFRLGADTDLNVDGELVRFEATE